ncbi:membrane protein insertion efficiency factor YidD [Aeromonas sp. D3]|uniref:membrane protein insertion efficiency factor YidD n=1 Tax=Aeromonas sp. D3 TaxID=2990474 RepID=UPI0022DF7B72|nr:membrane protein insertion efficiency factor YidD [Aeromonas sp. D3]
MRIIAILAIRFYQKYLRQLHNRKCIYTPSYSNYTIAAIEKHGVLKGCHYGYLRIKRCNGALYKGGEDLP